MNTAQPKAAAGFDIANLNLDGEQVTFRVPIIFDKDGDPLSGFIIIGKNSPEYQDELKGLRAVNLQKSSKRKTAIDTTTEEGSLQWVDQQADEARALALAATVGWFGWTSAGVELPFDKAVTDKWLKAKPTWREKITAALDAEGNFIKA